LSSRGAHSGERPRFRYSFGNYTLDTERRLLFHGSEELALQRQKSFDVLAYLVEHHGRLVTKAELMEAVWPDTAVTDNSLAQCIVEIRRVLDDSSQQLIRTVARRGYVFAAQITTPIVEFPPPPAVAPEPRLPGVVSTRAWNLKGRYALGAGALALIVLVSGALSRFRVNSPGRPDLAWTQITNFTDSAVAPALSPDGRMVAFYRSSTWFHTPDQIYVKLLPNGEPVQLTNDPRLKYGLSFSPDGSQIAYTVVEPGVGWNTMTMSPLGGAQPSLLLSNAAGLSWLDERRVLFRRSEPALTWELSRREKTARSIDRFIFRGTSAKWRTFLMLHPIANGPWSSKWILSGSRAA
jgi:DNA-binding winged helix-turn-helix (wHTH) protein